METAAAREMGGPIAGVDEVGRGPWAGPVLAAAVIFAHGAPPPDLARGIDDSKALSARTRRQLAPEILRYAIVGLGEASVEEIDRLNILKATHLAMSRAVAALSLPPALALVDGNRAPLLSCPARTVVGGDRCCLSIAAASILAKVRRDALMAELAERYPGYGWERNAGYGTPEHRRALVRLGITPEHRRSFRPISEYLSIIN
jgi:ribonuclease HII